MSRQALGITVALLTIVVLLLGVTLFFHVLFSRPLTTVATEPVCAGSALEISGYTAGYLLSDTEQGQWHIIIFETTERRHFGVRMTNHERDLLQLIRGYPNKKEQFRLCLSDFYEDVWNYEVILVARDWRWIVGPTGSMFR